MKFFKLFIGCIFLLSSNNIFAQVSNAFYEGERITNVVYVFQNKLSDTLSQKNLEQTVKRAFPIFPQSSVRTILLEAYTNKVRKLQEVASAQYEIQPSQIG